MTWRELKRAGILFFFPALLFLFPFLRGQTLFVGDKTYSFQPWLTYAAQQIQAGHFPLWNPYSACGEPFVANPQVMLFNPTAILYWIFPFGWADPLFLLLSQGLLFLFTYLLARKWMGNSAHHHGAVQAPSSLAALAFAWGGYAVGCWEFPSAIGTLPFLPLFFLLGLGESWAALALATAMVLATGYIQFAYYAVFLALVGTTHAILSRPPADRRSRLTPLIWMTVAIGGGLLMSLVQILPSWESARQSLRAGMQGADTRSYLMTPIFLIRLWVPWLTNTVALAFQSPPFGPEFWPIQRNWLATLFMGTPVCLLALAGFFKAGIRKGVVLGSLAAISVILAFGIDPFFGIARAVIPGFRYLTHFSNAIVMGLLCLALISTEAAPPRRGRNFLLFFATLPLLGSSLALAVFPAVRTHVLHAFLGLSSLTPQQDRWVMEAGGLSATAILCFAGVWLFFRRRRWAVLWCFTLLELWTFGRTLNPWAPASFFHRPLALGKMGEASPHRFSVSPYTMKGEKVLGGTNLVEGYNSAREAFYPNVPLPFRIHQTWSYEVFGFREFAEFRRRLPDLPGESGALDFLGASLMMTTKPLPPPCVLWGRSENALLYTRPTPLARVTVAATAIVRPSSKERLDYLFGSWDPRKEVVLEEEGTAPATGTPLLDSWREEPGRVEAKGHGTGTLVSSGIYFPGWESYVNGIKKPILRANHAFQAVATPEGPWTVHLLYRPTLFRWGLILSVFVVLGFLGKLFHYLKRFPATLSERPAITPRPFHVESDGDPETDGLREA
jgi:hypothetical protein